MAAPSLGSRGWGMSVPQAVKDQVDTFFTAVGAWQELSGGAYKQCTAEQWNSNFVTPISGLTLNVEAYVGSGGPGWMLRAVYDDGAVKWVWTKQTGAETGRTHDWVENGWRTAGGPPT